jgi:hypothetical protein
MADVSSREAILINNRSDLPLIPLAFFPFIPRQWLHFPFFPASPPALLCWRLAEKNHFLFLSGECSLQIAR